MAVKRKTGLPDMNSVNKAFELRGSTDMGWSEIARKVGVSEQTLYYYQRKMKSQNKGLSETKNKSFDGPER